MLNTLKGYLIHEKVKDGSVGTVWRATNGSNREFALKQLAPQHARNAKKRREFRREATLTRTLVHPGVIRVHDYVPMEPQPFFVMEYFESENLKAAIHGRRDLIRGRECGILRQIAEALDFVHSRGIVHRDVKPENVLVSESGDVRLIDFSLAQTRWDRLLQFGRRTEGTPLYMAPEQVRGEKCDARTDVYGLGALAFELFAKRPPFTAPSEAKVLEAHVREKPRPPSAFVRGLPPEVDRLILRMLSKRRDDRPADLTEVAARFARLERVESAMVAAVERAS